MKRYYRWFLFSMGYLVYTVGVILFLLWFLFPADSTLLWLQRKLNTIDPSVAWEIGSLDKVFPLKIRLSDIRAHGKTGQKDTLFHIPEIQLAPDLNALVKLNKQVPVNYRLTALGGTVKGDLVMSGTDQKLQCSGEMQNMQIGDFKEIWKITNRTGSGKISGTFQYLGVWKNLLQGYLHAALQVNDGNISLQQQIFGLDVIDFRSLTATLNLKDMVASFENGQVDSRLFKANFEGTLKLTGDLYTSDINIRGFMEPRPELFGGLKNPTAVSFIRNQLQDDKLSFTVSGTFLEPGILFKGASGIIDGIIEGGLR